MQIVSDTVAFLSTNSQRLLFLALFYGFVLIWVPTSTIRIPRSLITGILVSPIDTRVSFDIRKSRWRFIYMLIFCTLIYIATLLALFVVTRRIIERWPGSLG